MSEHRAPRHLSADARRLWGRIDGAHELGPHEVALLAAALAAFDRMEQARLVIERDGLLVPDRFGILHANPAAAIERDSRIAFMRGIRELGLGDVDEPDPQPRRYRGMRMT